MTVHLRAHHLLCLLTYVGKGYSRDFVANMDAIAGRIAQGEFIEVVEGPDDVCQPMLAEADCHCWTERVRRRDALATQSLGEVLERRPEPGRRVSLNVATLEMLRQRFAAGDLRPACEGCDWFDLCSSVAGSDFDEAVI